MKFIQTLFKATANYSPPIKTWAGLHDNKILLKALTNYNNVKEIHSFGGVISKAKSNSAFANVKIFVGPSVMKKIFLFLFFVSILNIILLAQNEKTSNKFILNGKVTGNDTGFIYLSYLDENYHVFRDTAYLQNGQFSFTGIISEPHSVSLKGNLESNSDDNKNFTVFYLEAKNIEITLPQNDFKHAKITGSNTQYEWEGLKEKQDIIEERFDSSEKEDSKLKDTSRSVKELLSKKRMDSYKEAMKQSEMVFIAAHPKSYLSPALLRHYLLELSTDSAKLLYNNFDSIIQNSRIGKIVYTQIQGKSLTETKGIAPDFLREDVNGKRCSLAFFKDKSYVILNFWASWCLPCRQDHPHLKKLFNLYHKRGLNIVGISKDKDKNAWRTAILKDSISNWYQIMDDVNAKNLSWETKDNISDQYVVIPIPVLLLIDIKGIIIGRFEGTQDEAALDKKLSEIFR